MRLHRFVLVVASGLLLAACDSGQTATAPIGTALKARLEAPRGPARDFVKIDLGTSTYAVAINNAGQVVGNLTTASGAAHAFLWKDGGMTDLGTLSDESFAVGMNNRGQVIGCNRSGDFWRGFVWERGVMTDLGNPDGRRSQVSAINDAGQVIGYGWTAVEVKTYCFIWQNRVLIDLGSLGGGSCLPSAVNNAGQVVGSSETAAGLMHAFLWERGVMTDLGTLGGDWTQAAAINARGQVVGNSGVGSGSHAFLWYHGVMTDLGTLGGAYSVVGAGDNVPSAINDQGEIAGGSTTAGGENHAFLWTRGEMMDLGKLSGTIGSVGWAINNAGEMIGTQEYVSENCDADRVFYWTKGVMSDLPTPDNPGSECPSGSWPAGINNAGQVAGTWNGHAIVWQRRPEQ